MRDPEKGRPLRAAAERQGWRVQTPALDVTDDRSVERAVDALLAQTEGRIDVLVNNAGYYAFGPLEQTTPDELRAQLETNVIGVQRVTRAVLPAMRARGGGAVVTVGSISGLVAVPMVGPYNASKWALEGMIEAWRLELIPFGIRMSLVEPGPFATELHANERLAVRAAAEAGEAGQAESPYAQLLGAYRRQAGRMRRSADLGKVVDAIERAATTRSPRLRWRVGPTSFTAGRMRALVPDRLYEWLMRLAFPIRKARRSFPHAL